MVDGEAEKARLVEQQHFDPWQNEKYSVLTLADQAEEKEKGRADVIQTAVRSKNTLNSKEKGTVLVFALWGIFKPLSEN